MSNENNTSSEASGADPSDNGPPKVFARWGGGGVGDGGRRWRREEERERRGVQNTQINPHPSSMVSCPFFCSLIRPKALQ